MADGHDLALGADPTGDVASPEDVVAFGHAFLRLFERRTALYTMGDSSSVPAHVAADLLRSICFVLGVDPDGDAVPEDLLGVDLEREYVSRLTAIERRVKAAERLWRDVCIAMPLIPNIALRDTLGAVGGFFRHYDPRSMAHDIPCSIDYPLCHPVDEALQGIDYIAEYLRRLMIEARFLKRFDLVACERVLVSATPDHIELLINLYEPVAANAIGRALLGEEPEPLVIGDAERQAISARLGPLGDAGRARVLREAGNAVCDELGVSDRDERAYLLDVVPGLLPRIGAGSPHGGLSGVFVG